VAVGDARHDGDELRHDERDAHDACAAGVSSAAAAGMQACTPWSYCAGGSAAALPGSCHAHSRRRAGRRDRRRRHRARRGRWPPAPRGPRARRHGAGAAARRRGRAGRPPSCAAAASAVRCCPCCVVVGGVRRARGVPVTRGAREHHGCKLCISLSR
jgi:hypothetical protein